ncbi:MFS transporter [Candidatus Odyssella acanthamoebae]
MAVIYNSGAIFGGLFLGSLYNRIGRCKVIIIASILILTAIPLWTNPDND